MWRYLIWWKNRVSGMSRCVDINQASGDLQVNRSNLTSECPTKFSPSPCDPQFCCFLFHPIPPSHRILWLAKYNVDYQCRGNSNNLSCCINTKDIARVRRELIRWFPFNSQYPTITLLLMINKNLIWTCSMSIIWGRSLHPQGPWQPLHPRPARMNEFFAAQLHAALLSC